jgi:hypothetical protein
MPAKKKPSMREIQARKMMMQKIAKGGPQRSGVKKPEPAKAAPSGRQPRAITNGGGATMKQIRAKAVQARRQGQGKPVMGGTKGRAMTLPNSVRAGKNLVKAGAQQMRTIGDSPTVRAAAQQGQRAVEAAKRNRARMAAGVGKGLKEAAALKTGLSALRGGAGSAAGTNLLIKGSQMLQAGLERAGFKPPKGSRSQAEINARATPKPATPKPATPKGPTASQRQSMNAQETKARQSLAARKKATGSKEATPNTAASFDDAFKDARRAKAGTFTWRGKKYTTKMK